MNVFLAYFWAAVFSLAVLGLVLVLLEPVFLALRAHRAAINLAKGD
jgi:hypothetical protein